MAAKILGLSLPVATIAAIGAYLLYKKSQVPAPAAPVNGLGYMPNTIVADSSALPGMSGLGATKTSSAKAKALAAAKAKKLRAAQIKAIKAAYKAKTLPQMFATTTAAQLSALYKGKRISSAAYKVAKKFIANRDAAAAAGATSDVAVSAAAGTVPGEQLYVSPSGAMISSGEYSSGQSFTDVVYTGNDSGSQSSSSGQSFTDTVYTDNDSGSPSSSGKSFVDPIDSGEPTPRFDTPPASETETEATPAGGGKMAMAAAAAAGAFLLFRRH